MAANASAAYEPLNQNKLRPSSSTSLAQPPAPEEPEELKELIKITRPSDHLGQYFFANNSAIYYEPTHIKFFKNIRNELKKFNSETTETNKTIAQPVIHPDTQSGIKKTVKYLKQKYPDDFEGKIAILKSYIDPDNNTLLIDDIVAGLRGGKLRGGKTRKHKRNRKNKSKSKSKSKSRRR